MLAVDLPGFGETEPFEHDPVLLMDELDWTPPSDTPPEISLIWGTDDAVIPIEVAREFATRYPVDLIEISGGGHAPYTTHPMSSVMP